MNFRSLVEHAAIVPAKNLDHRIPTLPKDGQRLFDRVRSDKNANAVTFQVNVFQEDLCVSDQTVASSSWYASKNIKILYWHGDLQITGDLIDNDWANSPILVVTGNLIVRSWLRGGMPSFIGGTVYASGFVLGHYNDSALFVGGDLKAAGYIPRARPYPDLPGMLPHQIAGRIEAKTIDGCDESLDLNSYFVDDVLLSEDDEVYLDEPSIVARVAASLPVWK